MSEQPEGLRPSTTERPLSPLRDALDRVRRPVSPLLPLESTERDGHAWWRLRGLHALVALAVVFNLWSLRAERLPVAYPNDSGMHFQMTDLARRLLAQGVSPFDHWYPLLSLGSPFFVQYQSLSAVLTGALGQLFNVHDVYAWSLYLLLSLWPLCVYASSRLLAWGRWPSALAAAMSPLLFTVTGRGFGHQSSVWIGSGLWSQLWAMWTLPLAWALSWRFISQRKSLLPAVLALSLTIAFHFLTAYLAALTLVVWVLIRPSQFLGRLGRAALLGVASLLMTAWVTVPLFTHSTWLAVNQFQVGTPINDSYGARQVLKWLVSGEIYDWKRLPIITVFAAIGIVVCVRRWYYDERGRGLLGAWVLSLLLFFGRPTLGPLLKLLPGSQNLLLQRYIMGLHLAGLMLAGIGLTSSAIALYRLGARRLPDAVAVVRRVLLGGSAWLRTPILIALAVALLSPAWTQISTYDGYSRSWITYQRYADITQGAQVDSLVATAETLGGGRVYAGMPSNWGHHFYVGGVPVYIYLEQLGIDAVGFTLRTSGLMTDPEAYFDEYNPGDYSTFGVHYVILPKGHTPPVPMHLVETQGPYRLWRVGTAATTSLFQVVDTHDVIFANNATLGPQTTGFLRSVWPGEGIYPTIGFAGAAGAAPTLSKLSTRRGTPGTVLSQSHDLVVAQSARATVVARRTSVVLMKVAFDPGWRATVDGHAAPVIMLAPALMGVEVSAGTHVIVFTYHGYSHYLELGVLAVLTLAALALEPWWRRRRVSLSETDPASAATADPQG